MYLLHGYIMSLLFCVQIADYVIDPMCRGIFAGSAHSLSMRSAFPAIHQYETSHGSIIRGALLSKSGKTTIHCHIGTSILSRLIEWWDVGYGGQTTCLDT